MVNTINLETGWLNELQGEFEQPYMQALKAFLQAQKQANKVVFPPSELMFNAFNSTPFNKVKVVILGQDPYHGPDQAHGLAFSVPVGIKPPPSLVNIFKEIERDLDIPRPSHGCLQQWAEQGVLLLNATLSVEQAKAGSHQNRGWEAFTDAAIEALNRDREGVVFLLWGSYAQKKGRLIDTQKHLVLKSPHPSPLSAHRGFIGNGHFSQVNSYLQQRGLEPIEWGL
ncbi:uracil-DNA glycosylase [Gilvimarinus agarilyticus]|uniref:uracil-DNA glycosylase n=1 Tax=unclassified Gilvimarinus TaxID=2642066 RepID=UPI001C0A2C51|nr:MULTISPECIES: uracil-DNA glycosylase [unclassified Gilvimarinus]MBU2885003.1 uracil-DNA glycosylase [Gilvimarinus agarilyticus]MDO6569900.1 uracil-DNA glycosylase [Gilvimarinus sp. 2_MG-2023]MDO6747109.1 uracil-DNA glycosylase [Gilvimarinus sp. 1_MG-2023]